MQTMVMGIDRGIKGEVKPVMPVVNGSSVMNVAMIKKNGNNPSQTIVQMMALIKITVFFSINDILPSFPSDIITSFSLTH